MQEVEDAKDVKDAKDAEDAEKTHQDESCGLLLLQQPAFSTQQKALRCHFERAGPTTRRFVGEATRNLSSVYAAPLTPPISRKQQGVLGLEQQAD